MSEQEQPKEESYETWRERELGTPYMVWHDGVSPDRFARVQGGKRDYVIRMLLRGLDEGDDVAAVLLGGMDADIAAREFKKRLSSGSSRQRVEMARWLARNEKGGAQNKEYAEAIAGVATEPSSAAWGALIAMRDVDTPEARAFLLRAVAEHPDGLARYHAAESLLHIGQIKPSSIADHDEIFGHLATGMRDDKVTPESLADWKKASEGLRILIEKK